MTENRKAIEAVMERVGCDSWIASHALSDSGGDIQSAVELVRERVSYQKLVCHCGEQLARKWSFCPYCGVRVKSE